MKIDCIIGIDPGSNGGIVVWRPNHNATAIKMPKDINEIRDFLNYYKEICIPIIFLEKLSVRPDDVTVGDAGQIWVNCTAFKRCCKTLSI